jgi:hypothetical protein
MCNDLAETPTGITVYKSYDLSVQIGQVAGLLVQCV